MPQHQAPHPGPQQSVRRCAILAGGRGTRIGGGKPLAEIAGRPLLEHAIGIAREAGLEPVIVAKPATELGAGGSGCRVLLEPPAPSHPLLGIATALEQLGEAIVVCPCDMPLLPPSVLGGLAVLADTAGSGPGAITVVAGPRGIEPLLGRYEPAAAPALRAAAESGASAAATLREAGAGTVAAAELGPGAGDDPALWLANVNTPADREAVERALNRR